MTLPIIKTRHGLLDLNQIHIMGILNITPDSFHPPSRYADLKDAISMAEEMIDAGATILDIGAASSRPGSDPPDQEEEIRRLKPVVRELRRNFPEVILSIDTYRSVVLRKLMDEGIDLCNDISAGAFDPELFMTVAELELPYILMHMKGSPQTMHKNCKYEDMMLEILIFFAEKIRLLHAAGIHEIILDPGIGFSKKGDQNFKLIKDLEAFRIFDLPLLIGLSRKSFIYRTLDGTSENALNGTTALHMLALQNGANILRVHDVREAVECLKLWGKYQYA